MESFVFKFLKFGIVGFSGVVVDFSVTWLCKEKARLNKFLANSLGFATAASTNYLLNRLWTFQSHNQQVLGEYIGFIMVSVVGLAINNTFLWYLHEKRCLNFYLAKLFAIGITTVWNFLVNYFFVFTS